MSGVRRPSARARDQPDTEPAIAGQWHPTRNGRLIPQQLTRSSHWRVWWVCARGHEWQARVATRTVGRGCPRVSTGVTGRSWT